MQTIKCVTAGDGAVGKTSMLSSYINGAYIPGDYVPTIFDTFEKVINIANREITLELWDTAGQEDYERLRPLSYPNTDVILLCFSVAHPSSFVNIELKWIKELKHYCPFAKIILIGTKEDLREDPKMIHELVRSNEEPISYSDGIELAMKIGADKYLECSAFTREGVIDIFNAAVEVVLFAPVVQRKPKSRCTIL